MSNNDSTFVIEHPLNSVLSSFLKTADSRPAEVPREREFQALLGNSNYEKPEDLLSTSGMLAQEYPRKQRSEDAIVQLVLQQRRALDIDGKIPRCRSSKVSNLQTPSHNKGATWSLARFETIEPMSFRQRKARRHLEFAV